MTLFSSQRGSKRSKAIAATGLAFGLAATAGVVGATYGLTVRGGAGGGAVVKCPGGMTSLEHVFDESNSFFEGDPETHIEIVANIADDGYLVEALEMGSHTGTHIDAPGHFIEGGRTVDELTAAELVMPLYVIDVRDRMAAAEAAGEQVDFQLTAIEIRQYERANKRIKAGSLVVIQTGFDQYFGTEAFDGLTPGFSGDAVQWLVDNRNVGGIGSDTYGPDATSDEDYDATYTILLNDRVAVPGLNNLDAAAIKGDLVFLSPVRLGEGSGFQVNPVLCQSRNTRRSSGGHGWSEN